MRREKRVVMAVPGWGWGLGSSTRVGGLAFAKKKKRSIQAHMQVGRGVVVGLWKVLPIASFLSEIENKFTGESNTRGESAAGRKVLEE